MESDSSLAWVILATSVVGYFVFSVVEASLLLVRRERAQLLVAEQVRGSVALESLHMAPAGPTSATSLLKALLLGSGLLALAALVIGRWDNWGIIAVAGLGALFATGALHIAARSVAALSPETIALTVAPSVRALAQFLKPVTALSDRAVRRASNGADDASPNGEALPLELGISDDSEEGLDEREAEMIRGVVRLDKTTAREIMLPRLDIVAVELGTPLTQVAETMVDSGHSRIPVYEESLDVVKGIAYVRDILKNLNRNGESLGRLSEQMIRPAMFIPETKDLEELLNEIQETRVHMAIVVDEYGGVSGLVTIEDLLEEIVGEIQDEFDVGEPELETISEGEFLIDARTGLDELNQLLDLKVEGDGFDTVGGFVYDRLGKIPAAGDRVEYDGLQIEVVSTVGRRLKKLRVVRVNGGADSSNK